MVNPKHTLTALLCKWIVYMCKLGESIFKNLLKYRLKSFQPHAQGKWGHSLEWFTNTNHKSSSGSKQWGRVTRTWRDLILEIHVNPPLSYNEWMCSSFWWNDRIGNMGPEFSQERVIELHQVGIQFICNVWQENSLRFILADEACLRFGLRLGEYLNWDRIYRRLIALGRRFKSQLRPRPRKDEWIGLFETSRFQMPIIVFQGSEIRELNLTNQPQVICFNSKSLLFFVREKSCTLGMITLDNLAGGSEASVQQHSYYGFAARICIQSILKGPKKRNIMLYFRRIKDVN